MMIASADATVITAFAVGFVSFISPCVLPLVPGYLSAVSGVTVNELREGDRKVSVIGPALVFCLSFTVMFVALGMSATGLGKTLREHQDLLETLAGSIIVALGVFFVLTPFIPRLNKEWRPEALIRRAGAGGPIVAGLAFAVAWTPCIGPTLGAILTAASTSDTVGKGGVLLAFYSLGLAIPFLLTAVAFERATTAFRWLRDHYLIITFVSGAVLIAMGILILTGEMRVLNSEIQDWIDSLHLQFLYDI
jgi:cytochrome c-type biogenesis protein